MASNAIPAVANPYVRAVAEIRPEERISLAFFVYLAALGMARGLTIPRISLLLITPAVLFVLCMLESARSTPVSRVFREWGSLGLILAGYWSVGLFQSPPRGDWQEAWVQFDRLLLNGLAVRSFIEGGGRLIPSILESTYLLLYAIPPISLGALYLCGRRCAAGQYLRILFLGTFTAYAMLPLFPVTSPRIAFPTADLPTIEGIARPLNTWILDHLDIAISVFPSGHVAVAFSSAFGLWTALRGHRLICMFAFLAATAVFTATFYGRYHYAVDGIASIFIATVACVVVRSRIPGTGESR